MNSFALLITNVFVSKNLIENKVKVCLKFVQNFSVKRFLVLKTQSVKKLLKICNGDNYIISPHVNRLNSKKTKKKNRRIPSSCKKY